MAYEYPTVSGSILLVRRGEHWAIEFDGCSRGQWPSPDDAAEAVAHHRTGLSNWDRTCLAASDDLLRWRPLGESL